MTELGEVKFKFKIGLMFQDSESDCLLAAWW
jgi:hypothetical protein